MKISELTKLIDSVNKKGENQFAVNPLQYFVRLYESHDLTIDNDVQDFFELLQADDFFSESNMPKGWSMRSYSSAVQSLYLIMTDNHIRDVFTQEYKDVFDVNEIITFLDDKKKYYNNLYRKQQRQAKKEKMGLNTESTPEPDEKPHQMHVDEYILNTGHNDPIKPVVTTYTSSSDSSMASDIEDISNGTPFLEKKDEHTKDKMKYIVSLLDKYMSHETDEFKKVYLEVVRDQLLYFI